jgi:hypothetical protein
MQPEANPYKHAKTIIDAFELVGSHTARLMIPENAANIIITLNVPILSARYAGRIRPKVLVLISKRFSRWDGITLTMLH